MNVFLNVLEEKQILSILSKYIQKITTSTKYQWVFLTKIIHVYIKLHSYCKIELMLEVQNTY